MEPTTSGLVRRARELAALARKATPGPWRVFDRDAFPRMGACQHIATLNRWKILRMYQIESDDRANAELISAAPEMARLLAEVADALERKGDV